VNPGIELQARWRWNGRPLRVGVQLLSGGWEISWHRWGRHRKWTVWRVYRGTEDLRETIRRYRDYAAGRRGMED